MIKKRSIILMLAVFISAVCLFGCGVDDINVSGYQNMSITLSGLEGGDRSITVKDLKEMECVTKKTHSTSDKIGEVRATGPLLDTVLEPYGVSQSEFSKVKIYAKDDYAITLSKDILDEKEMILAFGMDGMPLDEEDKPVRIIIPESDSAYWIRMVEKIEFIK
ncbi:molybdopterin-dependent oxidoreductase [Zhenpiania hominis]|uniref:molybdopterin-dependent oxidoreductase n=1 Tax=Zhenpiania hominis TaxID=2763644 RepID=UPI0039F4B01B